MPKRIKVKVDEEAVRKLTASLMDSWKARAASKESFKQIAKAESVIENPHATEHQDLLPAAFRFRQAARYLGIGIHNFRALVHAGTIPARLQGSQRLFLREDLDAYLNNLPIDAGAVKATGEGPGEVRRAPRGFGAYVSGDIGATMSSSGLFRVRPTVDARTPRKHSLLLICGSASLNIVRLLFSKGQHADDVSSSLAPRHVETSYKRRRSIGMASRSV